LFKTGEVEQVSAIFGYEAVDYGDDGAEIHEAAGQFDPMKPRPPVMRMSLSSNRAKLS